MRKFDIYVRGDMSIVVEGVSEEDLGKEVADWVIGGQYVEVREHKEA